MSSMIWSIPFRDNDFSGRKTFKYVEVEEFSVYLSQFVHWLQETRTEYFEFRFESWDLTAFSFYEESGF